MAPRTRPQRLLLALLGTALVIGGVVVFVKTDGLAGFGAMHLVSAVLVVAGFGTIRLGTRPRRDQVL